MKNLRPKYKLTFVHKFLCIGLLFVGILLFLQPQAYHKDFMYMSEGLGFPYLQKGAYELDIYYNAAPVDNELLIYSDALTDAHNQPGVIFQNINVGTESGKHHTTLELAQDTRNVYLKTSQDIGEQFYISRVTLQSVQLQDKDNYFLSLGCILGAAIVLLLGWYASPARYKVPGMLVVMGLLASMPLYSDFIVNGDDLGFHIARLESIYEGLRSGQFPVYLGTNKMGGFGMLSATMYPDFFLYPFALLRFFGISLMLCYKLLVICMHIGTSITSYYSAKNMCSSSKIGFWTSVFYTFAIYRLTNTYFRASLGETLAMTFLPLVIWGIYEVLWGNYKKWYLLVLGISGVIHSHVLSAEMCVFFLIIEALVWGVSRKKDHFGKRLQAGIKAVCATILVNAFFLVPFLFFFGENLQCLNMPNQLSQTVVYFSQMFTLLSPAQGMDLEPGSTIGEMPHTIGIVLLLGAILLCVEALRPQEADHRMEIGKRCLAYGALGLFMSSWLFPWDKIQSIDFLYDIVTSLQFAWRFLAPASILLSIAAAVGVVQFAESMTDHKWVYGVAAVLVVCSTCFFFDMKGQVPAQFQNDMSFNDFGYTDAMYMYYDGESFKAHNLAYDWEDAYIQTLNGTNVAYSDYERQGTQLKVTIQSPANAEDYLLFPFYHYPGYEILVNGEAVEVMSLDSLVACKLPTGVAAIAVAYRGLPGFAIANWVSLISVLGIAVYIIGAQKWIYRK